MLQHNLEVFLIVTLSLTTSSIQLLESTLVTIQPNYLISPSLKMVRNTALRLNRTDNESRFSRERNEGLALEGIGKGLDNGNRVLPGS